MGISRWLFNDWFTAAELDHVDARFDEAVHRNDARHGRNEDVLRELRGDVGRLALLTRALVELCVERGVLTRQQLKQKMLEIDLLDGRRDGRIAPGAAVDGATKDE
jgi:hypothetical protein